MANNCFSYVPLIDEYFAAFQTTLIVLLVIFVIAWISAVILYVRILKIVRATYEKQSQLMLIAANGIFPVVIAFSIVSLSVPFLSEKFDLLSFIVFAWCAFALYRYIHMAAGGHEAVREMYESTSILLRSGNRIQRLAYNVFGKYVVVRYSIIQFTFLTTVVSIAEIVLYLVNKDQYYAFTAFFIPISVVSIIFFFVAFSLLVRYLGPTFSDPFISKKFQYIRLVVLAVRLQVSVLQSIFRQASIQCDTFNGQAWSLYNLVKQPLIVTEVTLLAYATWRVYRREDLKDATR